MKSQTLFKRFYLLRFFFSFLIRLRCHFQRIWPFFFQRLELLFILNWELVGYIKVLGGEFLGFGNILYF